MHHLVSCVESRERCPPSVVYVYVYFRAQVIDSMAELLQRRPEIGTAWLLLSHAGFITAQLTSTAVAVAMVLVY